MELDSPRIRDVFWNFKPLGCLDAILTTSDKVNNTLGIEPASISNCLKEDTVQFIYFGAVFSGVRWGFVDGFKSDQIGLTP
jgi:hypothetical protein